MSANLSSDRFAQILARAKMLAQARRDKEAEVNLSAISTIMDRNKPQDVDISSLGIPAETVDTEEGREQIAEILGDVSTPGFVTPSIHPTTERELPKTGVAAKVTLNKKQESFLTLAKRGEDLCLLGPAGTGKTTATGRFVRDIVEEGVLEALGSSTKVLDKDTLGAIVVSFTRKAVNNIKRAVPVELIKHTLTMHKVLEFEPVFYEAYDDKNQMMKKTMKFEPKRTALNPLPAGLRLIIYEESSMIGVDLYNLMAAACPHQPQEIFIGDIRQLPPVFGLAILGFKMALLETVELDEVYRQALLSPVLRLAHAVLSGDSNLFDLKKKFSAKEPHKFLKDTKTGKPVMVERIHIPSLEAFEEDGAYGKVEIQVFQKKLTEVAATGALVQQFIAWEKSGYYQPDEDIILCPFNKSLGTIELNKGIQNYLGRKRNAVVHEVIARSQTHYLAVGDRVLFDKEDAFITEIRRNATYLGKAPQPADVMLDRHGCLQKDQTQQEMLAAEQQQDEDMDEALDRFMLLGEDEEDAANVASHSITIEYAYSGETQILISVGDVNALLGGNAITVHKMQGSENPTIFIVLHHTHAAMVSNELLYTAITRARTKLHVICEQDTFFQGVKRHKVRGRTLHAKMEYFRGRGEMKEMIAELELMKKIKDRKRELLLEERTKKQLEKEQEDERNTIDWSLLGDDTDRWYDGMGALWQEETSAPEKQETSSDREMEQEQKVLVVATVLPPPELTANEVKLTRLAAIRAKLLGNRRV